VNETGVDMLSLIKEHKLPSIFPEQVVEEAKKCGNKIDEQDIKNRIDLRNEIIFTIDGAEAKDLDDAIGITRKRKLQIKCSHCRCKPLCKTKQSIRPRSSNKRNKYIYVRKSNSNASKRIIKWYM